MLPYNEIKKDVRNGHKYMEYEGKWYGYNYTIVYETNYIWNSFYVQFREGNFFAEWHTTLDEFMAIPSYKEYVKFMNEVIYYNGYEVGDE